MNFDEVYKKYNKHILNVIDHFIISKYRHLDIQEVFNRRWDILQDVWTKICAGNYLEKFDPNGPKSLPAYLGMVTKHVVLSRFKHEDVEARYIKAREIDEDTQWANFDMYHSKWKFISEGIINKIFFDEINAFCKKTFSVKDYLVYALYADGFEAREISVMLKLGLSTTYEKIDWVMDKAYRFVSEEIK